MPTIEARYSRIRERIKAAADAAGRGESPKLIAVSKKQSPDAIEALYRLGQRDFGENYAQELLEKAPELAARGCDGIRWHFIGHLQTNKVKALLPVIHSIHSVDSEKLGREIAKRREGAPLEVFLEINIDREPSKSGAAPEDTRDLAAALAALPQLRVAGLMCIPAAGQDDPALISDAFRRLRELEESCRPLTHGQLSMGMTGDFEAAIHEGSTHIRIGTAIFGQRK